MRDEERIGRNKRLAVIPADGLHCNAIKGEEFALGLRQA